MSLLTHAKRVSLCNLPTAVDRLETLGSRLGLELWAKRDDRSAGTYGGNKVRKLELLLADALQRNAKQILTVGAIGSNHVLATGIYARRLGLGVRAVVVPRPMDRRARDNVSLAATVGVESVTCSNRARVPFELARLYAQNPRSYLIEPGGSSPLGTLGYVLAAQELSDQIARGELDEPDDIVVPLGSGGTMAGLIIGCGLAGLRCRIVGVRVVDRLYCNQILLRSLMHRTLRLLEKLGEPVSRAGRFAIVNDQFGQAYGQPTPAAVHACRLAAQTEGLLLETTYSGKAMAALLARARKAPGRRVLFWLTFNSQPMGVLRTEAPMR